jgi:hypothetical protein
MARLYVQIFIILAFVAGLVSLVLTTNGVESHIAPALRGYQELPIIVRQDDILTPPQAFAGRTLITQINQGPEIAHTAIFRVPDDVSEARLAADLSQPRQRLADAMPTWFYRALAVGMPDRAGPNGGEAFGVVDLRPGRYVVIDPMHPARHARFTAAVTPRSFRAPDPVADLSAEMFDGFVSLPARMSAGQQVWRITNSAASVRELAIVPVPAGATTEQAMAAYNAEVMGAPVPTALGTAWHRWNRLAAVGGAGGVSPGQTTWSQIDLSPGTYAIISTVPTLPGAQSPVPGLIRVFTVTGGPTVG